MVAGFRTAKDQGTIVKALNLLDKEKFEVWFAGIGDRMDDVKQLVESLGITGNVRFLGLRTDIPNVLKAADVIVMSSHWEGLSLSNVEGMSQNLPSSDSVVLKGIREEPSAEDGARVLVDRLWPRGVSKERAALDEWAKDATPTTELRRTFHSGEMPWPQFVEAYRAELTDRTEAVAAVEHLRDEALKGRVTLLFAGHDHVHCHARVLREAILGIEEELT